MSSQDTDTPGHHHRATAALVSVYLIGSVLWRLLVTAHEYPSRTVQVVGVIFDVFAVGALVGLRPHVPKPALFWAALVAGFGLFAIRFTSDDAWWTGHLMYSLPAR